MSIEEKKKNYLSLITTQIDEYSKWHACDLEYAIEERFNKCRGECSAQEIYQYLIKMYFQNLYEYVMLISEDAMNTTCEACCNNEEYTLYS